MKLRIFAAFALLCVSLSSPAATVAPVTIPVQHFVDQSGKPCANCQLFTYAAGTSTPQPTYTDSGGVTQNTNPIILNVSGAGTFWVDVALSYKFVLKSATGSTLWTVDNVKTLGAGGIVINPSGSQTITQPPGTDFNVDTSGGGKFNYNGSEVITTATGILSNPTTNQLITQPSGTSFNTNNLNGTSTLPSVGLDPTGVIDNSSIINPYIAANPRGMVVPPGSFFMGTYTNLGGVPFSGNGNLLRLINQQATGPSGPVTANRQQINSYADTNQFIIGREHLTHFERSIAFSGVHNIYQPSKVIFSGDSTTAGVNITDSRFLPDKMFGQIAVDRGFLGVSTINAGHSGDTSAGWLANWLSVDMAANPDVYIMRWGINDGSQGITPQQTIANMRAGMAQIRSTRNVDSITLVLMMPSSTNDGPNHRDYTQYEQLRNGFVQAARDYQAVFVDTYAWLQDSNSAISSMDAPYQTTPGPSNPVIHVHPDDYRNVLINSILVDAILPSGYQQYASNNFINVPSDQAVIGCGEDPDTFPVGISLFRATGGPSPGSCPYDGFITTFRSVDYSGAGATQYMWSYNQPSTRFAIRAATDGTHWKPWKYFDDDLVAIGPGSEPKPPNSTYIDYLSGSSRMIGQGADASTVSGVQIIGTSSDSSIVDTYIACTHAAGGVCGFSKPIAGPYSGAGNAAACFNAAGQLYRATGTSCP